MSRIHTLPLLFLFSTLQLFPDDRPNIVLILADDMGYSDVGAHGCKDIPTPHIDRIANEGVRFTQAYANGSFCTPTRIALLGGRYQQRTGNDDLPEVTGKLPLAIKTLSDRLQESGYTTGMVGKWHVGEGKGFNPLDRGFDEFYGFLGGGHTYFPDRPQRGSYGSPIFRQHEDSKETRYLTDAFGQEAADFLKRHRKSTKPIFLYLAFNAVHTPMHATPKYLDRFPDLKGNRRIYAAMLSAMDDAIGNVLKELDDSGKADNTLLIFHNDIGGPTTRNAVNGSINLPLRGSKCETFEGGIRVPLFMRWPGKLVPNSTFNQPVMTFDLSATALHLAGADTCNLDGKDLRPYLFGEKSGRPHATLYWRSRTRNNNYAVRHGDWKYVYSTEGTEQPGPNQTPANDMLFDLANDPGEQHNLSKRHPEILAHLKALYKEWDAQMDADCQELGIQPPAVRGQTTPKAPFLPTSSFPGFDHLENVTVEKVGKNFRITSNVDGVALQKLPKPITGKATFSLNITPSSSFPSNGFFAFGKEATNANTMKCGLLVGGNRITIYQGLFGAQSSNHEMGLTSGKTYQAQVKIDVPERKVTLTVGDTKVTHDLPEGIDAIHYIGNAVVRSHAEFSEISAKE
jgi:arylsulfatase A-like enzyme